jgi:MerR family transcriptional regulator, copper efflux regulator
LTFEPGRRSSFLRVHGLRISELAARSGVPATTLRFYEQEGLLPAERTSAGYRVYDEAAVDRLAFITTAKGLGLALPEIRRLLQPWQFGVCADVRTDLAPLLEGRISEAGERIAELETFTERLVLALAQLEDTDRDGPCDSSCTFLGRPGTTTSTAKRQQLPVLAELPQPALEGAQNGTPIACSLGRDDRTDRAARWAGVLEAVTSRETIPDGTRLTFDADRTGAGDLAALADAEARCCPFFAFTLRLGPPLVLEVRAPADALPLVDELFTVAG